MFKLWFFVASLAVIAIGAVLAKPASYPDGFLAQATQMLIQASKDECKKAGHEEVFDNAQNLEDLTTFATNSVNSMRLSSNLINTPPTEDQAKELGKSMCHLNIEASSQRLKEATKVCKSNEQRIYEANSNEYVCANEAEKFTALLKANWTQCLTTKAFDIIMCGPKWNIDTLWKAKKSQCREVDAWQTCIHGVMSRCNLSLGTQYNDMITHLRKRTACTDNN